jgi:hypothetical protein
LPFLCGFAVASAQAQELQENLVLSASAGIVRWAAVYKIKPERPDDPYLHVRVFEHHRGWKPWQFKELAFHMAVTPKALAASRIDKAAKIFNYKDVEIRAAYHRWLDDPAARSEVPVCDADILSCIQKLRSARGPGRVTTP